MNLISLGTGFLGYAAGFFTLFFFNKQHQWRKTQQHGESGVQLQREVQRELAERGLCYKQKMTVDAKPSASALTDMRLFFPNRQNQRREEIGYSRRSTCFLCLEKTDRVYMCVPCGHACLCEKCVTIMQNGILSCPFCKKKCQKYILIREVKS